MKKILTIFLIMSIFKTSLKTFYLARFIDYCKYRDIIMVSISDLSLIDIPAKIV